MSWAGVITMIGVVGVIWGGFLVALVSAVRHERRRLHSDIPCDQRGGHPPAPESDEVR